MSKLGIGIIIFVALCCINAAVMLNEHKLRRHRAVYYLVSALCAVGTALSGLFLGVGSADFLMEMIR